MDEAFLGIAQMIEDLSSMPQVLEDNGAGVRSYIRAFEIETPIELDVYRGENGLLQIGTVPPLYRVNTSFRPWYHQIRIYAELDSSENEINGVNDDYLEQV